MSGLIKIDLELVGDLVFFLKQIPRKYILKDDTNYKEVKVFASFN